MSNFAVISTGWDAVKCLIHFHTPPGRHSTTKESISSELYRNDRLRDSTDGFSALLIPKSKVSGIKLRLMHVTTTSLASWAVLYRLLFSFILYLPISLNQLWLLQHAYWIRSLDRKVFCDTIPSSINRRLRTRGCCALDASKLSPSSKSDHSATFESPCDRVPKRSKGCVDSSLADVLLPFSELYCTRRSSLVKCLPPWAVSNRSSILVQDASCLIIIRFQWSQSQTVQANRFLWFFDENTREPYGDRPWLGSMELCQYFLPPD